MGRYLYSRHFYMVNVCILICHLVNVICLYAICISLLICWFVFIVFKIIPQCWLLDTHFDICTYFVCFFGSHVVCNIMEIHTIFKQVRGWLTIFNFPLPNQKMFVPIQLYKICYPVFRFMCLSFLFCHFVRDSFVLNFPPSLLYLLFHFFKV